MLKDSVTRGIRCLSMLAVTFALCSNPAAADIVYNYDQEYLFDSNTGYYWQALQVFTSTMVPSQGTMGDYNQLTQLGADAGILGLIAGTTRQEPYSPDTANFISFFASDSPAVPGSAVQFGGLYSDPYDLHLYPYGGYQYFGLNYEPAGPGSTDWVYIGASTLGPFGPASPCGINSDTPNCPFIIPALVYSTTPLPVPPTLTPLPSSVWLLVSGLALAAGLRVGKRPSSTSSLTT